ncbi:MAG: hypothetical protein ACRD6X_08810 [Pyrinomonadaceae bacterium]
MDEQKENSTSLTGMAITEEQIGFEKHQLAVCSSCGKPNGPDRRDCIYCGRSLPRTEHNADVRNWNLRPLEDWETAFNVVIIASENAAANLSSIVDRLGIEHSVIADLVEKRTPLPLVRIESRETADEVSALLRENEIETRAIHDREIDAANLPTRIRAIELDEDFVRFVDFNTGKERRADLSDIVLVVSGGISESRREEVTRRKRGSTKILDEHESGSDHRLIDIYTDKDNIGFRLSTHGFDFSILGEKKDLFAVKNIATLQTFFSQLFSNAVIADEYDSVRGQLDRVWEPSSTKNSNGLQMHRYGKREFGATYVSNNLVQFTKYSRMRRLLI